MKKKKPIQFVNLNYIVNSSTNIIREYLKYNGTDFNDDDTDVLIDFVNTISLISTKKTLQSFVAGYKIERLNKEFDLIKMDDNNIINIELKQKYADLSQAIDNYKILNVFYQNSNIYIFCYCKENRNVYIFNHIENTFEKCDLNMINEKLSNLIVPRIIDIDFKVFSLYNNPNFFLQNEYCLSESQIKTYEKITDNLDKKMLLIQGDAGVGKSLLALHIHKELISNNNSCFLAPIKVNAIINNDLIEKYNILTVKEFIKKSKKYDYIVVDEAQNLSETYVEELKKLCNKCLIMFGDRLQDVKNIGYFNKLCSREEKNTVFNMKRIIRTNNTFVIFAKKILNIDAPKKYDIDPEKIQIKMSDDEFNLNEYVYIEPLKSIYFQKCTNNNECNRKKCLEFKHKSAVSKYLNDIDTCSLEYDKVAIYLCDSYKLEIDEYGKKNIVPTKKSTIYYFKNELYLMLTRPISSLLIIVDDLEMYNYLMSKKEELY